MRWRGTASRRTRGDSLGCRWTTNSRHETHARGGDGADAVSEKGESTGSARIARHGAREGARSGSQKEDGRSCARDRISRFRTVILCSASLEPTLDMVSPVRTCEGNNPKPSRFPSSVEQLRCLWCDNRTGSPSTSDLREALQAISVDVCMDWPATENAKGHGRSRASRGHPFSVQLIRASRCN